MTRKPKPLPVLVLLIGTITVLTFMGCSEPANHPMSTPAHSDGRFQITRVAVIEDSLAYGDRRGVYVIRDTKTGKEYVGVSGVGIADTGDHQAGKNARVTDER